MTADGADVTTVTVTARVVHASAYLSPSGNELLSEYGLSFEGVDEATQDEVRDFLLDVMAADSSWHGPAGEDA